MIPDFIANVTLFPSAEGGRKGATPTRVFGCPLSFEGRFFDCRMLLGSVGALLPGEEKEVPIKMLDFDAVRSMIKNGTRFEIWEGRVIGEGIVMSCVSSSNIRPENP